MPKRSTKPKLPPLTKVAGEYVDSGQDNTVYRLAEPSDVPHLRAPTGYVVKINHPLKEGAKIIRRRDTDERQAAELGVQYKKNKYEILKRFLGKYIPDSYFLLGDVQEYSGLRPAEYTIQKEVPRFSLNDLTEDQKADPRLIANVKDLMGRMKYMYGVIGQTNARMAHDINLDAKLDLGGISDYVRAETIDHVFDGNDARHIIDSNTSPNLLVDPDTMDLYCVDFDQGQWLEGMDEAKAVAFEIADRYETTARKLGSLAIDAYFSPNRPPQG